MVVVLHRIEEEVVHILEVEEAQSLVVGAGRSLEEGIVAVVDSYVAAPGRGRRTWWWGPRKATGLPSLGEPDTEAQVGGCSGVKGGEIQEMKATSKSDVGSMQGKRG